MEKLPGARNKGRMWRWRKSSSKGHENKKGECGSEGEMTRAQQPCKRVCFFLKSILKVDEKIYDINDIHL